jgi:hypothetical protein
VANPTPQQQAIRDRFESVIGILAPVLDLVLATGDRISRAVGPEDEYYPIRSAGEAFEIGASPSASAPEASAADDEA